MAQSALVPPKGEVNISFNFQWIDADNHLLSSAVEGPELTPLELRLGADFDSKVREIGTVQSQVYIVDGDIGLTDRFALSAGVAIVAPRFLVASLDDGAFHGSLDTLRSAAVRAPGHGDRRKALLEDFGALTGATVVSADAGPNLSAVSLKMLGSAKRVIVTKNRTTLIDGAGAPKSIEKRLRAIKKELNESTNSFEQAGLQERLSAFGGSVVTIRVGGTTEIDATDDTERIRSSLRAVRSAIEEGWVPGGGLSLLRSKATVDALVVTNDDEAAGIACVSQALEKPIRQLILSASRDPDEVLAAIETAAPTVGFNADTGDVQDVVGAGILDSARMTRQAVRVGFAHIRTILETSAWQF